nr:EOG090X0H1B [Ilyocryptus agilis]
MQTDEEVGKAVQITSARNAKTLSPAHLKQCILAENRFDFLKDLVMAVPDVQGDNEEGASAASVPTTPTQSLQPHHPLIFRSQSETSSVAAGSSGTSRNKPGGTGRPRGRPRKNLSVATAINVQNNLRIQATTKSGVTDSDEDEDSNDEDDEDEEEEDSTADDEGPRSSKGSVKNSCTGSDNGGREAESFKQQSNTNPQIQFNAVQPNFYQEIGNNASNGSSIIQTQPAFQIQINLPPAAGASADAGRCDKAANGLVARTAFSRRRRRRYANDEENDDFSGSGRGVLLRRLSQTTQTDTLLGEFDLGSGSDGNKIILRPKTVQERIRELNVRARQFADAVTEIGCNNPAGQNFRLNGVSSRSLQVTPWGSPRMLSPVDVRHIVPELSNQDKSEKFSPAGSPSRHQRWMRGGSFNRRKVEFDVQCDPRVKEIERLWCDERNEIMSQLRELLSDHKYCIIFFHDAFDDYFRHAVTT